LWIPIERSNICILSVFKSIAANIEVTQYIDGDLVIEHQQRGSSNGESLPEIENVRTLSAETSTCLVKQLYKLIKLNNITIYT